MLMLMGRDLNFAGNQVNFEVMSLLGVFREKHEHYDIAYGYISYAYGKFLSPIKSNLLLCGCWSDVIVMGYTFVT